MFLRHESEQNLHCQSLILRRMMLKIFQQIQANDENTFLLSGPSYCGSFCGLVLPSLQVHRVPRMFPSTERYALISGIVIAAHSSLMCRRRIPLHFSNETLIIQKVYFRCTYYLIISCIWHLQSMEIMNGISARDERKAWQTYITSFVNSLLIHLLFRILHFE